PVSEDLVVAGVHAHLQQNPQQVLLKLCSNATQAMNNVGHVQLQIDARDVTKVIPPSYGLLARGRYARIPVTDTGPGVYEAALGGSPIATARRTELGHSRKGCQPISSGRNRSARGSCQSPFLPPRRCGRASTY